VFNLLGAEAGEDLLSADTGAFHFFDVQAAVVDERADIALSSAFEALIFEKADGDDALGGYYDKGDYNGGKQAPVGCLYRDADGCGEGGNGDELVAAKLGGHAFSHHPDAEDDEEIDEEHSYHHFDQELWRHIAEDDSLPVGQMNFPGLHFLFFMVVVYEFLEYGGIPLGIDAAGAGLAGRWKSDGVAAACAGF